MSSHQSRVGAVIACYIIPIPLEILSTGLRLWSKQRLTSSRDKFSLDDFFIVFATVSAVGECIVGLVYGPPHGFGRHTVDVSAHDLEVFQVGNYVFSHFYNIALGMVKLSILTFYYRTFVTPIFRKIVLASITFIALWVLTITLVLAVECRPIQKFWNPLLPGKCFNLVAVTYFTNISNLVTDLWIFLLPIPVIWRLHITQSQKLGLCGVFLIGLGTCIISSVRISVVVAQASDDFMWTGVPLGIMSAFEPLGGILSANLPVCYALFVKITRKVRSSFYGSAASSGSQSKSGGRVSAMSGSGRRGGGKMPGPEETWIQLEQQVTWSTDSKPSATVTYPPYPPYTEVYSPRRP